MVSYLVPVLYAVTFTLILAFIRFVFKRKNTFYERDGERFRLYKECECYDAKAKKWCRGVILKNCKGDLFVYDQKEFLNTFVPVKGNK